MLITTCNRPVEIYIVSCTKFLGFPGAASDKEPAFNAGAAEYAGSIPGLERSPREGHGNPLQYSCLEKPMDRGAWQAIVHGVTKSQT